MPRKPKGMCSYPGCPELTNDRFCEGHRKQEDRRYDRENRPYKKLYNSSRWQRLRKQFLMRHPLCVECKKRDRVTPATVVDHVIPHKGNEELFWNQENWQALCKSCHDRKTAKEDGRWRKKGIVYTY